MERDDIIRYQLVFNEKDNVPPGMKEGEPIDTALNRLGKTMLSSIPVVGVDLITFHRNEGVVPSDDLKTRIGVIFLSEQIEDDRLILKVTSGPEEVRQVTTSDIVMVDGERPPIAQNIPLTYLPPGKTVHLELTLKEGTADLDGERFSVVTEFSFFKVADDNYIFQFTMARTFGYPTSIYKLATDIINGDFVFEPEDFDDEIADF